MKKLTALFMALILMITCLPTTVLAQKSNEPVVSGEVRKIEGETIVEEDGKAYVAFDIGNIKLKESKMKKRGKRDLTLQTIYRQNTPASNPYDRFKLKVIYLGRGLSEFKLPTQDVEIVENGARKTIKAFEVKLSTSEPSTSTVKEVVLGHRYVQESEVGFTQAGVVAYPFTMDTSVQDLDTKLEGSLRILVPYTYLYHPELNIEDSRQGTIFVLYLKQKVNPLWKSEWHIKDEQNKPDIFAYYKHTQEGENSYFKLPKDDKKVYTMESGKGVTDLYWDGTGVVNAYPENKDKAKEGGHFYPIIIGKEAIVDRNGRDYTGKISYDNLKFTSNATTPNITTGFGDPDTPNTNGFIKVDNVKYLLNLYPTDKQQTDINAKVKNYVTGEEELAYRQIKRYAVYEALEVKFNTGKGKLEGGNANADIGTAQEIGYSEKIANNESGRTIKVPTDTLVPPDAEAGKPANEFKGWALSKDATAALFTDQASANAYATPFTETTTFYAIYGPKAQGKVKVEYVDASNQPIDAKYQLKGQEYPPEKPGNIGETVGTEVASTAKAPKFLGYEVTGVDVKPATGQTTATYTNPATATVTYKYKKLDPIIPEDKATQDVKDTYKPVTIKVDSAKGELKKGATKAADINVYYVNPVEGKSLQDVLTASGLTPESKDANVYKIDTAKPWKFDPTQTEGTPTVPAADFALTTVVGKDNVKDTGVTMEVNFKETDAEKYGEKLKAQDIVKWVGDQVDWTKGVEPITGVTFKNVEDLGNRNTKKPGVFTGKLKVTFNDDSTAEVDKQKLIVREKKADKKEPKGEDPGTYPDDAIEVKFVAGTGIEKLNPANKVMVLQKDETLVEGDYPAVTVDSNYKAKVTKLEYYDVQPGKITNPEPQQGKIKYVKTITASTTIKGEGSAEVVYKAGTEDITAKIADLKIAGQTYPANNKVTGTEDTVIDTTKITQPELLGYEKDGAITTEPATNAMYTEAGTAKVIFHYKKVDDIIGPVTPNDTKPAGYVEVIFKSGTYGKFNPDADVKYFVNPKTATIDTTAQTLSGNDKSGTAINKNFPTAEIRDNYKAVWTNDLDNGKQKWALDPTDAISGTKIKDNFDSNKTITFTALYKEKDKKDVTFTFEFYKGSIDPANKLADNKKGDFNPTVSNLSNKHVGSDITLETFDTLNKKVTTGDLRGTWAFDGWYRNGTKVTGTPKVSETDTENVFTGKWIITEDPKYSVTYKYKYNNGTGINNPSTDGIEPAPTDSNKYYENVNVPADANKPSKKVVQVKESGKVIGEWVFQGWEPNPLTISSAKANEFIGTWEFTEKLVRPVDPNHPDKQADEVEVKFLKGEHGTLSGIALVNGEEKNVTEKDELAYYVKTKATWAAMTAYIPKAVADYGWSVANPSWKPVLPDKNQAVLEATFTAQYVEKATDITLTLDENYRNGKITDYDVEEDELIRPYLYTPHRRGYVFEGWSYNSRHLEEVRPGDRIYEPTVLYAIWTKDRAAKDKRDEEPEDTRKVYEHNAYIFGYPDGSVRPNGNITRAEAAAMLARLLNIEALASDAKPMFPDTPSSWYNKAINAVVGRGIMKGYPDGKFRPNAPITRAEFTTMIAAIDNKAYGVAPFADVKGHWAELAIGREYQAGRINGYPDGTFRPNASITRAEVVTILNRVFDRCYDAMSLLKTKNKEYVRLFTDLYQNFWAYYDMVEATNNHSFKLRNEFKGIQEDWVEIK